jgi:hypothetical protein
MIETILDFISSIFKFISFLLESLSLLPDSTSVERKSEKSKTIRFTINIFIILFIINGIIEIKYIVLLDNFWLFASLSFLFGISITTIVMLLFHRFGILNNIEFPYFITFLFVIGLNSILWLSFLNRLYDNVLMK